MMKMTDDLYKKKIKPLFAQAKFCSVATVNSKGMPHVSPIGSVVIVDKTRGYYFEKFTKNIPLNATTCEHACIMPVNSGSWFWLKSLIKGKFSKPPAIRLLVKLGNLREATETEGKVFKRKVNVFKKTKGYQLLWRDMSHIREFEIIEFKPVFIGKMTKSQFL
ncbi:MAG: pyridoxamine 5'-phosphate oxidase family protein [Proteobacteria bacterium]|nr:pyridoxamine 5'-phosphate oxidase family protein [Pseudomonadota bacterium]